MPKFHPQKLSISAPNRIAPKVNTLGAIGSGLQKVGEALTISAQREEDDRIKVDKAQAASNASFVIQQARQLEPDIIDEATRKGDFRNVPRDFQKSITDLSRKFTVDGSPEHNEAFSAALDYPTVLTIGRGVTAQTRGNAVLRSGSIRSTFENIQKDTDSAAQFGLGSAKTQLELAVISGIESGGSRVKQEEISDVALNNIAKGVVRSTMSDEINNPQEGLRLLGTDEYQDALTQTEISGLRKELRTHASNLDKRAKNQVVINDYSALTAISDNFIGGMKYAEQKMSNDMDLSIDDGPRRFRDQFIDSLYPNSSGTAASKATTADLKLIDDRRKMLFSGIEKAFKDEDDAALRSMGDLYAENFAQFQVMSQSGALSPAQIRTANLRFSSEGIKLMQALDEVVNDQNPVSRFFTGDKSALTDSILGVIDDVNSNSGQFTGFSLTDKEAYNASITTYGRGGLQRFPTIARKDSAR